MKGKDLKKDEEDMTWIHIKTRNACVDCGSHYWSKSCINDVGHYCKCDKCHVWDDEKQKLVPRFLN